MKTLIQFIFYLLIIIILIKYLDLKLDKNESHNLRIEAIDNLIQNNLNELQQLRKKEYPLCLKWHPEIFKEMYNYYKYKKLPVERFKTTTNASLYISRFKELANKSFYLNGDRLCFIKKSETSRLSDGELEDIEKVILKKFHIYMKYYLK